MTEHGEGAFARSSAANAPDILEATAYADKHVYATDFNGDAWEAAYFAYLARLKSERKREKTNRIPMHHFNGDEPIDY